MGRLPDFFAGTDAAPQRITFRTPYTMAATILLPSGTSGAQFAPDVFTHSTDRPFEIHRMIPRAYAIGSSGEVLAAQPDVQLILGCINNSIEDFGKQAKLTKATTPLSDMIKGTSEISWEWAEPYFLLRDEGLISAFDSLVYPFTQTNVRVAIAFQGFLLTLAPASDRR